MRTGVTIVDITRAADQLLADGERPTVEGIRKLLGTGSPSTVNTLLKQYYQTLPTRLNLPAPIAMAAAELYDKVRATAMEEVNEARTALEKQIAADGEQLTQDRRAFESEKTTLRAQTAGLSNDVDRLQEQNRSQATKISSLEKELATQTERATSAEAQSRSADSERERTAQKHATEIQRLREQAEGNERHFLARIEDHKAQFQRLGIEREKDAAAFTKRISVLENSVSEASKLLASVRSELATAQRDLAKRAEAAKTAELALQRVQDEHAREIGERQSTFSELRVQFDQLEKSADGLRRERDDAIRAASRLEGKVQTLQAQLDEANAEIRRLQKASTTAG